MCFHYAHLTYQFRSYISTNPTAHINLMQTLVVLRRSDPIRLNWESDRGEMYANFLISLNEYNSFRYWWLIVRSDIGLSTYILYSPKFVTLTSFISELKPSDGQINVNIYIWKWHYYNALHKCKIVELLKSKDGGEFYTTQISECTDASLWY